MITGLIFFFLVISSLIFLFTVDLVHSAEPTYSTQSLISSSNSIKPYVTYIHEIEITKGSFEFSSQYPVNLSVKVVVFASDLRSVNIYLLKTSIQTIRDTSLIEAIKKDSVTPFNETSAITNLNTSLSSKFTLSETGIYAVGFGITHDDFNSVFGGDFDVNIEYYTSGKNNWSLKELLHDFEQGLLLHLWITNPLLIGLSLAGFIFCDFTLTRKSYIMAHSMYFHVIRHNIFELNPNFQDTIHENKPLTKTQLKNFFKVILSAMVASSFLLLLNLRSLPSFLGIVGVIAELFLGFIFTMEILINLEHIESILIFDWLNQHPTAIRGLINVVDERLYRLERKKLVIAFGIWLLLFIGFGKIFFLGGVASTFLFSRTLLKWQDQVFKRTSEENGRQLVLAPENIKYIQSEFDNLIKMLDTSDYNIARKLQAYHLQTHEFETKNLEYHLYILVLRWFEKFLEDKGLKPEISYTCPRCGYVTKFWYRYCNSCKKRIFFGENDGQEE